VGRRLRGSIVFRGGVSEDATTSNVPHRSVSG